MPQMLASQNKPECESQEHFEWCQLSACQSDISLPPMCPSLCVAWTRPRTHPCECSSLFLPPMWMLPLQIQRVLMNADVFVSFFWRSCAAMERWTTAHVTPFTRRWDRSKAEKKPRDEEVLPGSGAWQVHSHVLRRKKREDSECTTHEQKNAVVAKRIYRHIKWHVVGHRLLTFTGIWLLWTASQPGRTPVWCLFEQTPISFGQQKTSGWHKHVDVHTARAELQTPAPRAATAYDWVTFTHSPHSCSPLHTSIDSPVDGVVVASDFLHLHKEMWLFSSVHSLLYTFSIPPGGLFAVLVLSFLSSLQFFSD